MNLQSLSSVYRSMNYVDQNKIKNKLCFICVSFSFSVCPEKGKDPLDDRLGFYRK